MESPLPRPESAGGQELWRAAHPWSWKPPARARRGPRTLQGGRQVSGGDGDPTESLKPHCLPFLAPPLWIKPSLLSPKEPGFASFPNSWTRSLVSVIHPTLHHSQVLYPLSLKVGPGRALLNLSGKPLLPSFSRGQTLTLHFFRVKSVPFSLSDPATALSKANLNPSFFSEPGPALLSEQALPLLSGSGPAPSPCRSMPRPYLSSRPSFSEQSCFLL